MRNLQELETSTAKFKYVPLTSLAEVNRLNRLPFSIRILLESALRNQDGFSITEKDIDLLLNWKPKDTERQEVAFKPGRVVLQDFTGVPALVDLASLRSALARHNKDARKINPRVPVDLVIDHSIQVDHFGQSDALLKNMQREFERNGERYQFLKWGEQTLKNFRVIPPGVGIVHQVNLEYLASLTLTSAGIVYPDSLVGTDSHTTMINALGILGWGVGGIEAEAVMLGQPIYMLLPDVIGFQVQGQLRPETTATDLVLQITQMLREYGVVGKFVEFFGAGLSSLSLPDRATIANMAPEYGATCSYFPVDKESLVYLKQTGRTAEQLKLIESYFTAQGLFYNGKSVNAEYSDIIELDLSTVEACLAGPRRPQDRIPLSKVKQSWQKCLRAPIKENGFALDEAGLQAVSQVKNGYNHDASLRHGSIVIAAITSCTNTSNPELMIRAGLLAKKAVERNLKARPYIKTSLAPGSRVVTDYLDRCKLSPYLEALGFHTVAYGCTTCIGNSGPLADPLVAAIQQNDLIATAVLSGNRNFEGRISPHVKANFLASPPLVIAYALAGNINIDLINEPLGIDDQGHKVYLKDIWPSLEEVQELIQKHITPAMYNQRYENINKANTLWQDIPIEQSDLYPWQPQSTYIQEPDFFTDISPQIAPLTDITNARCLVKVGDFVTTDHISPAGAIPKDMPAGQYLIEKGVPVKEFNSFGSRRGNDAVMTRGTFGNIRLRNQLAADTEGSWTTHQPSNKKMTIYEASLQYKAEGIPLIVLAGKEYGTGSSRDWAAKGTYTLGCRAVIASSFERIHRSNLVGMGILPLEFSSGEDHEKLGLTGKEIYAIKGIHNQMKPGEMLNVSADDKKFQVICRLDTPVEIEYYKNGGILHTVLRKMLVSE